MRYYFLLLLMLIALKSFSQDSTKSAPKAVFVATTNYQTKLHFYGRTDSLSSSGFIPMLNYKFKNGLYGQTSFIFTANKGQNLTYGGAVLEAGYKLPENKKVTGNMYFSYFLYNKDIALVQAALTSQLGTNITINTKAINFNINPALLFSNKTDFTLSTGLDKLMVYKFKKFALALNPSAMINIGSQQFYNTYTKRNTTILGLPTTNSTVTEEVTKLNVLSYDFSLPIVFVKGKAFAAITPTYVIPQHVLSNEHAQKLWTILFTLGIKL